MIAWNITAGKQFPMEQEKINFNTVHGNCAQAKNVIISYISSLL